MSSLSRILATELTPKRFKEGETWVAIKDNPVTNKDSLKAFGTWKIGDVGTIEYVGATTLQVFLDSEYLVIEKDIFSKTWRRK